MMEFARRSIGKDSAAAKRLSSVEEAIRHMQVGQPVILLAGISASALRTPWPRNRACPRRGAAR